MLCRSKVKIAFCFTISTASCWKTKIFSDKHNSDKENNVTEYVNVEFTICFLYYIFLTSCKQNI